MAICLFRLGVHRVVISKHLYLDAILITIFFLQIDPVNFQFCLCTHNIRD